MISQYIALPLLARILLVILFPFSALNKILGWNAALKQVVCVAGVTWTLSLQHQGAGFPWT